MMFLEWLWDRLNYLNSDEGLHHVAHFFIAGWIAFVSCWLVVLVVAVTREFYDIWQERRHLDPIDWRDHFWDVLSWLIGCAVWVFIIMPLVGLK